MRHVSQKTTYFITMLIFVFWTLYRYFSSNSDYLDEIIFKPLIWLLPTLIAVFLVESNNFSSLGFSRQNISKSISSALILSFFLFLQFFLVVKSKYGHVSFDFSLGLIFSSTIISLFTATIEETFFRGYLLNRWLLRFKKPLLPILINTIIFTLFHLPYVILDLNYTLPEALSFAIFNFISGLANSLLFYSNRNIISSITGHTLWNIFQTLIRY